MKRKNSVNIHGHVWKIRYVKPKQMSSGAWGQAVYPDREIRILNTLKGEMLKLTLWHECRHAFQFESGLAQILGGQAMELDAEGFASFVSSLKKQKLL